MAIEDPAETLRRLTETAQSVRFGRGVVGKTSHVAIVILIVWGVVVARWTDNLVVDAGLFVAAMAATLFGIWWIKSAQKFAERNPAQAMLEGAEFLEFQRMEIQAKGLPPIRGAKLIEDRGSQTIIPQDEDHG